MKLSHLLTIYSAATLCAPLLFAQQPASVPATTDTDEEPTAVSTEIQPDEKAIAALAQAGIERTKYNSR